MRLASFQMRDLIPSNPTEAIIGVALILLIVFILSIGTPRNQR